MHRFQQVALTLTMLCIAAAANAASLSFVYTGNNDVDNDGQIVALVGDSIAFDIVMDFSNDPIISGGYDVLFTTDSLRFEAWEDVAFGDPVFGRSPDNFARYGLLESAAFGSFTGLTGPATVARVSFTFLGGAIATVELAGTSGIGSPFISTDLVTAVDVDFGSATIRAPLPGAAWLLMSAMGALVGIRRRRLPR